MSGDTDPAEAEAPARAPVVACCRLGNGPRIIHGLPVGATKPLCGAVAAEWRVLPEAALQCPVCLARLRRQAGA